MNLVRFQTPAYTFSVNDLMNGIMSQHSMPETSCRNNKVPVNISENETHFKLSFLAPGFEKENFSIKHQKGLLTIKGELKNEESNSDYRRKDFLVSNFERIFNLPDNVDVDQINAKYLNGILNVELPKKEIEKQQNEFDIEIQ